MSQSAPILITGASQRIGLHCTHRLLEDGYSVIVTHRTEHESLERLRTMGVKTLFADFSVEAGILDFIKCLKASASSLRAIIHNASEWSHEPPDREGEFFSRLFNVHMLAPYLINLHCADLLMHSEPADIIHISDDIVRKGGADHIAYAASKAGLESLTLSFASRYAPQIKVNGIAPALIMFKQTDSAEYRRQVLAKSAIAIEPGPEVFYQSIRYLLDNPYLTGSTLTLNGGRHLK